MRKSRKNRWDTITGFSLIELVIVIVVLGIVAAVAIPRFGALTENSKINATKKEMLSIKKAIIGNPEITAGGKYVDRGFEGDVGFAPSALVDLVVKPDTVAPYDQFTRLGWNGPYLDSSNQNYLRDAWDSIYTYNPVARTITSTGAVPNITISF
jgi:prepilin-type N-terminal cleavage/methylation domain-containing protein